MRVFVAFTLAVPAIAFGQYKCTDAAGAVSFQQMPCESKSKQQALQLKTVPSNPGEVGRSDAGTVEQRMVKQMEKDRRVREIEQAIADTENAIASRNAAMSNEMAALRSRKQFASNNLAGATYEQALSSEMQAVAAKYRAINDIDLARLPQLRADLAAAKIAAATK